MESRDWVALIKTETGYRQIGPLKVMDVEERIQSGEIQYSDHVWRAGYKAWTRVGDIEDFGQRVPQEFIESDEKLPEIEIDLRNVVQQVRMPPDFSVLPPREEEPVFDMVKGLPLLDEDGAPPDFIEQRELTLTKRLHYRLRTPKAPSRTTLLLGAAAALIVGVILARPFLIVETPNVRVLPIEKRKVVPSEALDRLRANAPAEKKTVEIQEPVAIPKALEPSVVETPSLPAALVLAPREGTDKLIDLVEAIALKETLLEESYKSLRSDKMAWNMYFNDWIRGLEVGPLGELNDPDFSKTFPGALGSQAELLRVLHHKLLNRADQLNRNPTAEPSVLKSEIKSFMDSLKK